MRVVELCAGAGGLTLGLHRAGFTTVRAVESDPVAASTWRRDARTVDLSGLGPVALLAGGIPCQPFSTAGKRASHADRRNLWPTFVRAIDTIRPTWALVENVRGLAQHSRKHHAGEGVPCSGCYLDGVILPQLRERFTWVDVWVLNASSFGVPQHRRRLFIVAGPRPVAPPAASHGDPAALTQSRLFGPSLLPWVTVRDALGLVGTLGGMRNTAANPTQEREAPTEEPAPMVGGRGSEILTPRPAWALPGGKHPDVQLDHPCPTIRIAGEKYFGPPMARQRPDRQAGSDVDRASDALWLATGRRRLTIGECARLQDFPDDHPWQGNHSQIYRQIGNAVPPGMAEAVGRAIATELGTCSSGKPRRNCR